MSVAPATNAEAIAPASNGTNWKTRTYLIGAAVGLLLGLLSAYLFVRASSESPSAKPKQVKTVDLMKMTLAVLGLVRQFAELGGK